jgi:small-conductance mechanosensitive channel
MVCAIDSILETSFPIFSFLLAAFVVAALLSLGQFLSPESLALFAGLFTAAFSLSARPLIADMIAGIGFIFEDNFDVGEKIEIATATGKIEGVVESMSLQKELEALCY